MKRIARLNKVMKIFPAYNQKQSSDLSFLLISAPIPVGFDGEAEGCFGFGCVNPMVLCQKGR